MKIKIKQEKAYPWIEKEGNYFRGYFFYKNELYRDIEAINFLVEKMCLKILREIDGCYCAIIDGETSIYLISDRIRSFPLFYRLIEGELFISDDAKSLMDKKDAFDQKSIKEFKSSQLWVSGSKTLVKDIYNVQASQYVVFDKEKHYVNKKYYYEIKYGNYLSDNEKEKKFWEAYHLASIQLVQALNGRTAVIPLSGGHDSRMVLDMLVAQKYKK